MACSATGAWHAMAKPDACMASKKAGVGLAQEALDSARIESKNIDASSAISKMILFDFCDVAQHSTE
jgi:hypothetical protein